MTFKNHAKKTIILVKFRTLKQFRGPRKTLVGDRAYLILSAIYSVDQYLAGGPTFCTLPPGMRSVFGYGGPPTRVGGDQRVAPGAAAAAAAAGLLSRAAYRLAGYGGLLDARGRAQLASLAGFGVVVGGSSINHYHRHQYRPFGFNPPPQSGPGAPNRAFLPPGPVFSPADLHLVLYGYARSRTDAEEQNAVHSLSGLRINELSYG